MSVPKSEKESLVYGKLVSTVVPARVTGDKVHEINGIDLAMKLHYIKGVYFFNNTNPSKGNTINSFISILDLKNCMFDWLVPYCMTCGRVSTSPAIGVPPVIKLNDAGIRIIEAQTSKTLDEWLAMEKFVSFHDHLLYTHVLGPELGFSPLVIIQVTWFKCGGISVGLSWAHILGDAFSASAFMNHLGQYLRGHYQQPKSSPFLQSLKPNNPTIRPSLGPLPIKRIDPVGEYWVAPTNYKMDSHYFYVTPKQLAFVCSGSPSRKRMIKCFELISAVVWKSLAKVRKDLEPKVVTICRPKSLDSEQMIPRNGQIISTVEAKVSVSTSDVSSLATFLVESTVDESNMLEELVNREINNNDFIVYGANLTFVDLEELDVYGFELKGQHPIYASYTIGGIGDGGAVFVLPGPNVGNNGERGTKLVKLVLPQNEIEQVKSELKKEWCIA